MENKMGKDKAKGGELFGKRFRTTFILYFYTLWKG